MELIESGGLFVRDDQGPSNGADHVLISAFDQFATNRSSVSIVLKPEDCKEQKVFKAAKQAMACHNNCK